MTDRLKKVKVSGRAGISDRTDANLQLFMLGQYRHRIARFQNVANSSLLNISSALENGKEVEGEEERVSRLSRRSQSLTVLGVDTVDSPSKSTKQQVGVKLVQASSSSSSRRSLSPLTERGGGGGEVGGRKMNTFKSLSDHLAVLTKTYTNRR